MNGEKVLRKVLVLCIVSAFIFMGATTVLSGSAKAWDADVYVSPTSVSPGDTVTFEVQVTNSGSKSMEITGVGLHFDWMDDNYYYWSSDVSQNSPYVLGSGESTSFDITVPIPSGITTHTYHSMTVMVYAADPGIIHEWGTPYSQSYDGSIFVETPSSSGGGNTGGGTEDGNGGTSGGDIANDGEDQSGALILIAFMIFAIILIVVYAIYELKKRAKEKKESSEVISPVVYKEIKQSNARFCPHCGREVPADATICPYCGLELEGKRNE